MLHGRALSSEAAALLPGDAAAVFTPSPASKGAAEANASAAIRRNPPQSAAIRRNPPQSAAIRRNPPQSAANSRERR